MILDCFNLQTFNNQTLMVIIVITDNALDSTSKFGYGYEFSLKKIIFSKLIKIIKKMWKTGGC